MVATMGLLRLVLSCIICAMTTTGAMNALQKSSMDSADYLIVILAIAIVLGTLNINQRKEGRNGDSGKTPPTLPAVS